MISAYHLVWTAYGWWLPNDPRGSNSQVVRVPEIAELGELHRGRKSKQPASREIRHFYEIVREKLQFALLRFTNEETDQIALAFGKVITSQRYTCYACAVMPDHVHLLVRKHRDNAETMIKRLQEASCAAIRAKPQAAREPDHPVWGGPGWKRFLSSRIQIERAIRYVEQNPAMGGMAEQRWPFVTAYDGWIAGVGARRAKPQASRGTDNNGRES